MKIRYLTYTLSVFSGYAQCNTGVSNTLTKPLVRYDIRAGKEGCAPRKLPSPIPILPYQQLLWTIMIKPTGDPREEGNEAEPLGTQKASQLFLRHYSSPAVVILVITKAGLKTDRPSLHMDILFHF